MQDDFEMPPEDPEILLPDAEEADPEDDENITDPAGEEEGGEDDDEPLLEAREERKGRSASERVRESVARAKAAEEKAERLQTELMEMLRGQRQAPAQQYESPQVRAERLSLMTPDEKIEFLLNEQKADFNMRLQQIALQQEISKDERQFNRLLADRPEFKKYADQVEKRFDDFVRKGNPQSRESLLKQILGDLVLTKGAAALKAAKARGEENVRRQQTRPSNARSNVSSNTGTRDPAAAAEARLRAMAERGEYL
jgi:hypothetical protein